MADDTPDDQEPTTDAATEAPPGGLRLRRCALLLLASFTVSGLLALIAGGHFARPPLCGLRRVPLLGLLIPAPPEPEEEPEPEDVPTVADVHPLPAAEISELIEALQKAREAYHARQDELENEEERLRTLQADLQGERDRLDQLMAALLKRQGEVAAERQALQEETLLSTAEEQKRLAKLAKIYEAQNATAAAAELEVLNRTDAKGLAAKILAEMTEKKAAPIFDAMKPETALALKTQIAALRYQTPAPTQESTP
jgi:flagellar motility protein MotE (MotC chaperone)